MKLELTIILFLCICLSLYLGNIYLWQSWLWHLTPVTVTFSLYGVIKFLNHIIKQFN